MKSLEDLQRELQKRYPTVRVQAVERPEESMLYNTTLPMPLSDLECMEVIMWEEGIVDRGDAVDDACESITEIIQQHNEDWKVVGMETAGRDGLGFLLSRVFFVRGRFGSIDDQLEAWYEGQEDEEDMLLLDEDDEEDDELPPWAQDSEQWKRQA